MILRTEYVAGVAFKPGGTVPFMRMPAHEASDADPPLESLWGRRRAAALRDRLLGSDSIDATLDALEAVLNEMWRPPGLHPAVNFALAAFDRAPSTTTVATVTGAIGLSAKRFIERFKIEVGLTPKRYCRVRRFQRTLALANRGRRVDWTGVALDCGYFDQAHFIPISGRSRVSHRLNIWPPERRFRTTSNFYNPARAAFETMTPWQFQGTRTAR